MIFQHYQQKIGYCKNNILFIFWKAQIPMKTKFTCRSHYKHKHQIFKLKKLSALFSFLGNIYVLLHTFCKVVWPQPPLLSSTVIFYYHHIVIFWHTPLHISLKYKECFHVLSQWKYIYFVQLDHRPISECKGPV